MTPAGGAGHELEGVIEMDSFKKRRVTASVMAIVAFGLLKSVLVVPAAFAEKSDKKIKLGIGDARFWDGERVDRAHVADAELCGISGPCWDYPIQVKKDGGHRLRVALMAILPEPDDIRAWPDFTGLAAEMLFDLQIVGPAGGVVADGSTDWILEDTNDVVREGDLEAFKQSPTSAYSVEVFVDAPEAGTYVARVIPTNVIDMAFRMRAKLEGAPPVVNPDTLLDPNLRFIPPFEVGFTVTTSSFGAAITSNPHASCMPEEIADEVQRENDAKQLCLRYSMGAENVGDGRFDLRFIYPCDPSLPAFLETCDEEAQADPLNAIVHQRRWRSDGTFQDEPLGSAGTSRIHPAHAHSHYQNAYQVELFAAGATCEPRSQEPQLVKEGDGQKLGFEPTQEYMADFGRFYQQDRDYDAQGAGFALQAGWGDIYEWNRGGNYVVFPPTGSGDPRPGCYVLRGTTDPDGLIIESDETDNTGYALIEVQQSGEVDLLERGHGDDPWDPSKQVLLTSP
jgi:hypothetical protein